MRQSYVYFLRNPETSLIKIGTTINYYTRWHELQRMHNVTLELLGVQNGGRHEEQALHQRFETVRVPKGRYGGRAEWFRDTPELREYIQQNTHLNISVERSYVRNSNLSAVIRVSERTVDALDLAAEDLQRTKNRRVKHDEIIWAALKAYAPDLIKQIEESQVSERQN